MSIRTILLAAAALTFPHCAEAAEVFEQAKITAGEMLYRVECRRCHAPDSSDPSYGPPLENIIGRGAGTFPGYAYSEALAGSGIVWTPAALRAWMEDNTGFLPGTKMRHVGIDDRTVQDIILTYLASLDSEADGQTAK